MEVDKEYNFMGWFGKVFTEEAKKTDNGWLLPFKNMEEFLKRVEFHANKISTHPQREALDEEKLDKAKSVFTKQMADILCDVERGKIEAGAAGLLILKYFQVLESYLRRTFATPSLDEEKVAHLLIHPDSSEVKTGDGLVNAYDWCVSWGQDKLAKAICARFAAPSLEDLLSALPEKESEDDGPMDGHCDSVERRGFNRGRNVCIAALKGLWK